MPRAKKTDKVEEAKTETKEIKFRPATIRDYEIIRGPIVTEKSQNLQINNNTVVLEVSKDADKDEIKSAVEAIFNVKVDKVNIVNVAKKSKRVGRYSGYVSSYKKAIVKINKAYDLGEIAKVGNAD